MEESQYLMWVNRKQMLKSHLQVPIRGYNNSWEERAFAEDAARILGGCIWPPRSYSCSFCKREFRSAQALGGHMNVHRRDRARLKQSLSTHNDALHHKSAQFSAEICSQLDSCLNTNSASAGSITTSSLSALATHEKSGHQIVSPYSSIFSWGQHKRPPCTSSLKLDSAGEKLMCIPDSEGEEAIIAREEDFKGLAWNNDVETNLSVGLSSLFGQKLPSGSCGDEAMISCKRAKTAVSSLPVFLKPYTNDICLDLQSAEFVRGLQPGMEDLDLELRLGKTHKVN
ncbi:hypothetical protein L6164_030763 [Bauhinia variegata]|uniref:Uncharacterized protein n=1 Tax=Bauhinia variegata TaxID=167791 RepID=A0ACB9LDH2_BAUVA|nr:hypothetical protein L6164_030763 [Bauhinia variegata]